MIKILHLGLGRFHRAHQAVYYQRLNDMGLDYHVVSMSMRSSDTRDDMRSVSFRYPVIEFGGTPKTTWVSAIQEAYSCADELSQVLECFLRPELEIVTLTITEKGYDLNSHGHLDLSKIQEDLKTPHEPRSAIGILALGLHERRSKNLSGLTVISCDNLRENSLKLKTALCDYFKALNWETDLGWISNNVRFPNSMVDRIVPALQTDRIRAIEEKFNLGAESQVIATEEFSQWVIEDNFFHAPPPLAKVGVEFVKDVRPYEEMKLKLLNAAHSYLAYAGINRGFQYVHEAIADQDLRKNVKLLFQEVIPLLEIPSGFDAKKYCEQLIKRFQNAELPHQLRQIAMDGSQKLIQRIFPSIKAAKNKKQTHNVLSQVVDEWAEFCWRASSEHKDISDPLASKFKTLPLDDKYKWMQQFKLLTDD